MISGDRLVLADFGLACVYTGRNLYEICGTVGYQAPEMLLKEGYNFKVDMWSVGVVLYELLTENRLFQNVNKLRDVFQNWGIQKGTILDLEKLPQSDRTLVSCLLRRNPKDRPSAAKVLLHEHYFRTGPVDNGEDSVVVD